MSGIYFHIPFCKQACHYCDFHFSTKLDSKTAMVSALQKELELRRQELPEGPVETLYFGGGTPSLLTADELQALLGHVHELFDLASHAEITLEANPDDLNPQVMEQLAASPVNRLSIGVQSFREQDLKLMNRAHNAEEAQRCLELAAQYFPNSSLDLIYGIPGLEQAAWEENLATALSFGFPHISSYALTVEPRTALQHFIAQGLIPEPSDEVAEAHFHTLVETLEAAGFEHYELSNFGKPGFHSHNNTAYWLGKPYLGIGPSAHSYDGRRRSWNIANNPRYLRSLEQGDLPITRETLSTTDRYNEFIMTRLRTMWGVVPEELETKFGDPYVTHFHEHARKLVQQDLLEVRDGVVRVSRKGKFLSDGIASELFMINLKD